MERSLSPYLEGCSDVERGLIYVRWHFRGNRELDEGSSDGDGNVQPDHNVYRCIVAQLSRQKSKIFIMN